MSVPRNVMSHLAGRFALVYPARNPNFIAFRGTMPAVQEGTKTQGLLHLSAKAGMKAADRLGGREHSFSRRDSVRLPASCSLRQIHSCDMCMLSAVSVWRACAHRRQKIIACRTRSGSFEGDVDFRACLPSAWITRSCTRGASYRTCRCLLVLLGADCWFSSSAAALAFAWLQEHAVAYYYI